ncbi:hypothetical protein RGQ30_19070 [Limnobacter thiooxidans]|uniref:Uncharacterized protein n=1 Tax=Limnobacter thiooxidans TaxID=131080 RepID=A0AA86JG39_9BURK|nr:hypothetical protein RGQ30_19070 [Limnobacter thiooxidans]
MAAYTGPDSGLESQCQDILRGAFAHQDNPDIAVARTNVLNNCLTVSIGFLDRDDDDSRFST